MKTIRKTITYTASVLFLLVLTACGSSKDMAYFQDFKPYETRTLGEKYQLTFRTDDVLGISVFSNTPELAEPFNVVPKQEGELSGYQIDAEGYINFPVLGRIKAIDKSRKMLEDYIQDRLIKENLIKDPVVTVRLQNFKVLVLGEVKSPQLLSVKSDRLTLLDAIGMAGDLTPQARRDRVAVIREIDDERMVLYHDLRNSKIFDSPCFYLKQNDIVYIEPNKEKGSQEKTERFNRISGWALSAFSAISSFIVLLKVL